MTMLLLVPELVPRTLWGRSAYRLLKNKSCWKRIRSAHLTKAGNRCSICSVAQEKGLNCHEHWHYDDVTHVATLTSFAIICPRCNLVHHLGRARSEGFGDEALEHMVAVNGCTQDEAKKAVRAAFTSWRERGEHPWSVTVASDLLARWPELAILIG